MIKNKFTKLLMAGVVGAATLAGAASADVTKHGYFFPESWGVDVAGHNVLKFGHGWGVDVVGHNVLKFGHGWNINNIPGLPNNPYAFGVSAGGVPVLNFGHGWGGIYATSADGNSMVPVAVVECTFNNGKTLLLSKSIADCEGAGGEVHKAVKKANDAYQKAKKK